MVRTTWAGDSPIAKSDIDHLTRYSIGTLSSSLLPSPLVCAFLTYVLSKRKILLANFTLIIIIAKLLTLHFSFCIRIISGFIHCSLTHWASSPLLLQVPQDIAKGLDSNPCLLVLSFNTLLFGIFTTISIWFRQYPPRLRMGCAWPRGLW